MTVQCCRCSKVRMEGAWVSLSTGPSDSVSHTYCPVCLEDFVRQFRAEQTGKDVPASQFRKRSMRVAAPVL